ncbi:hypothetical protein [Dactylosporangium darangshiense]
MVILEAMVGVADVVQRGRFTVAVTRPLEDGSAAVQFSSAPA